MKLDSLLEVFNYFKTHYYLLFFLVYIMIIIWKIYKVAFELTDDEKLFDINYLQGKEKNDQIMTEINTKINGNKLKEAKIMANKYDLKINENVNSDIQSKNSQKKYNKRVIFKSENMNHYY